MKISVFGLGYVGTVTSACLVRDGHEVWGVDPNPQKVALVGAGQSPIIEPGLGELLTAGVKSGKLHATNEAPKAVRETDVSLISVGTPPTEKGGPDLSHVETVFHEIGHALAAKKTPHTVVLRSTVLPGTLERCGEILRRVAPSATVFTAFNPEFLREGRALRDYDEPPYTVVGTESADAERVVREMYAAVRAPVVVVKPRVAEMIKYVANAWHAAKISFANEIGRIARSHEIDARDVMKWMTADRKLNISEVYLQPGFAFGGSCLPKDLSALLFTANDRDVDVPLLKAIQDSNRRHIDAAARLILQSGVRNLAVFGLAFKPGTDDLRESPAVVLVKRLLGEGCRVKIFDRDVQAARLLGTNLEYIRRNLPHFEDLLMPAPEQALQDADGIAVTYRSDDFRDAILRAGKGKHLFDFAGLFERAPDGMPYHGLVW